MISRPRADFTALEYLTQERPPSLSSNTRNTPEDNVHCPVFSGMERAIGLLFIDTRSLLR